MTIVEELREQLENGESYNPAWYDGDSHGPFEVVAIEDEGDGRWTRHETVIVRHNPTGDHYAFHQDIGLTECQENEVYADTIRPVVKRTKTVTVTEWVNPE